jgi:hypothetical protein
MVAEEDTEDAIEMAVYTGRDQFLKKGCEYLQATRITRLKLHKCVAKETCERIDT